ncbi:hypothetical protein [Desulfotignum balticum]|uniref:hypothetical protein n=1 Tax=Desulfotignum balticum TaxID=115781 RepID=UPI0012ECB81B|nr:hypothetical protein [Desulfotignum balticum]
MKTATAWKLSIPFSSSAARTLKREGVECGQCIIFDQTTLPTDLPDYAHPLNQRFTDLQVLQRVVTVFLDPHQ